jgi:RND family efflux transporter MFP subunit
MATVTAIRAEVGEAVRRGQLLAEIDPQTAAGQLAQAKGGLGQARAALALAERNYQRYQALAATDSASELEVDLARTQFEQARAAVDQAEGAVSSASSVAGDSRVVAPFAGRVVRRMVEVGDLAAPGRPLFEIESEGARRFAFDLPESLAAAAGLATGAAVAVGLDARPDLGEIAGAVVEMTPGADPGSHSFRVKVALGDAPVSSGAAGHAAVALGGEQRAVVVVPAAAVLTRGGLELVVVRDADGKASTRAVTVGERRDDGRIEVLSGLAGGETVLVGLATPPPAGAPVEAAGAGSGGKP